MLYFCRLIGLHMWFSTYTQTFLKCIQILLFFLPATKDNNVITSLHVKVSLSFFTQTLER